jgi:serine/threonine-protein kinase HipA
MRCGRRISTFDGLCGWGGNAQDVIGELLVRIEPAIEGAAIQLPAGFPEGVAQAVFSGMRAQAKRLQEQPAS